MADRGRDASAWEVERLPDNPIIGPGMDARMGDNINGPSLVRVPDWVDRPLGRYYLYFAHHRGQYIRLAYADRIKGPWSVHEPGVLSLEQSTMFDHVASPDVRVDHERRELRMYFHGYVYPDLRHADDLQRQVLGRGHWIDVQRSKVALSGDGLSFTVKQEVLGPSYFRVFRHGGRHYALAMPGVFFRSDDGLTSFELGPILFSKKMRHCGLLVRGDTLHVFYSDVGDCPERILHATVDLRPDWSDWRASEPEVVLEPETEYEGVNLPLEPSVRGWAPDPVRQIRDPYVFEEDGELYLLYSVAGERGIAIARLRAV